MQEIGNFLEKLGMPEYGECFAQNKIDLSVLPHLTDQDLKDIGVPLGHRRKMLAAIRGLPGELPVASKTVPTGEAKAQDTAERRQVTVMFSDLVGSTALSARMDPEDLREIISSYQKCVAETVQRFGGFVAKYMGDGVLVYFGYPQAHEDDAERAVRAGLELIQAVGGMKCGVPLQTRVGIATGLVVVGDLIGKGSAQEQAVVGETPNLAARLQGIAEPNTVVIAESTRKLLGNLFDLQDLGGQDLKGHRRSSASLGSVATGFSRKPSHCRRFAVPSRGHARKPLKIGVSWLWETLERPILAHPRRAKSPRRAFSGAGPRPWPTGGPQPGGAEALRVPAAGLGAGACAAARSAGRDGCAYQRRFA